MTQEIELALNALYLRQITTREQLIREALRVAMTRASATAEMGVDELFSIMKFGTESKLGHFRADREDFYAIYMALSDIDLFDFVSAVCENDREGHSAVPHLLTEYVCTRIAQRAPKSVLVPEAERVFSGLRSIIAASDGTVTITTQNNLFFQLLQFLFRDDPNISVRMLSIYMLLPMPEQYDYIFCLPAFGGKVSQECAEFLTRDYDGVALENLMKLLSEHGTLDFIAPAKITFASGGYDLLRKSVLDRYWVEQLMILPEGTFRPWTAIKTYLLSISSDSHDAVQVGELAAHKGTLEPSKWRTLTVEEFAGHGDWRIELLLSDDDENLRRFRESPTPKVKLREIADVFRGKSILKKDTAMGDIAVLNISDIEDGEIDYDHMDAITEDERKVKRYELQEGDVVLSCRGTAPKTAVFSQQGFQVIASANIIVLRLKGGFIPGYVRLFLESPVGSTMLQSFQRGSGLMNLSPADLLELEISALPEAEQSQIANHYEEEKKRYKDAIAQAEQRIHDEKEQLFERMI